MIVVIICDTKDAQDVINLLFAANKDKYVKFNFSDAKNCFQDIFKNIRISSSQKYTPFVNIVNTIEQSNKIVLISDCDSSSKINVCRKLSAKFVNIGCLSLFQDTDLYIERIPKTLKETAEFLEKFEQFIYKPVNTLYTGEGWILTEE